MVYIGSGRDLVPMNLRILQRNGFLEPTAGNLSEQLHWCTTDWKDWCAEQGMARPRGILTPLNCGLAEPVNKPPELSTRWKVVVQHNSLQL